MDRTRLHIAGWISAWQWRWTMASSRQWCAEPTKSRSARLPARSAIRRSRPRQKLRPEEYTGGTFSLTNLGMYGIREFYAIINPPESGILAVGQVEKRPVVIETDGKDTIEIRRRLTLTLSCDHRIVDGALGAQLLAKVVEGLREPMLLVL